MNYWNFSWQNNSVKRDCEENNFWLLPGWQYVSSICRAYPLICIPMDQQPRSFYLLSAREIGSASPCTTAAKLVLSHYCYLAFSWLQNESIWFIYLWSITKMFKICNVLLAEMYIKAFIISLYYSLLLLISVIATCHLQYLMFIKRLLRKYLCSSKAGITAMHRDKEGELCNLIPT